MAERSNHYERALAWRLRSLRVPTISVDESRRTFLAGHSVKSLDFVVRPSQGRWLLVDVKGRRVSRERAALETWATREDLEGLERWQSHFGPGAVGLLAFVYDLAFEPPPRIADRLVDRFEFSGRTYACLAVPLDRYRSAMRTRSPRWGTVCLSRASFVAVAAPLTEWLGDGSSAVQA